MSIEELEKAIFFKCESLLTSKGNSYLYYGNLHIILADLNTDRHWIEACKLDCLENNDIDGAELCDMFLAYISLASEEQLETFISNELDENGWD